MLCTFKGKAAHIAVMALVFFAAAAPSGCAQSPQDTQAQQGAYTTQAEGDLSSKIDKTIKVLTVMREELDRMKADEKKAGAVKSAVPQGTAATTAANPEWSAEMRGKLSAMIRMWKRTDQIMNPAPALKPGQTAQPTQADAATAELNSKIDSAIKAMEVIKEELESVDKESSTGATGTKK